MLQNNNWISTVVVMWESRVGAAADNATANVSQGAAGYHNAESKITHDVGYSLESRGRKKSTNKTTRKRVTQRCGTPNLSPNSDGGELLSSHSTEGLAANDDDPSLQTRKRGRPRKTVGEPSNSHVTERLAANDNGPSQQRQKRGRRKKTVGQSLTSHVTERPDAHDIFPSQQTRKRGRTNNDVARRCVRRPNSPSHMFDWALGIGSTIVKPWEIHILG